MSDIATIVRIGPEMHGMRMSLAEFAHAEAKEGYIYELERGIIVVDVPKIPHARIVQNVRDVFGRYRLAHPDRIYLVAGHDSVLRLPGMESERHPDVTVYLTAPSADDETAWDNWCPDIVAEVVSKSSVRRNYEIKREEYLHAGVRTYWIVDPLQHTVLALTRKGDMWQEFHMAPGTMLVLPALPGFSLPVADLFSPLQ